MKINKDILKNSYLDLVYPIGSIYMSVNSANPATLFGGTWESFGAGKTLIGIDTSDSDFNTVNKTGGSKSHYHNLPFISESSNTMNTCRFVWNFAGSSYVSSNYVTSPARTSTLTPEANSYSGYLAKSSTNTALPPYVVVYMWKRTA